MQPTWIYRAIQEIAAVAPVRITAEDHDVPASGWPCWVAGVQRMQGINREPPRERPHQMRVLDANTLEIPGISATGQAPGGSAMELRYRPPVDLAGSTAEMRIFDRPGGQVLKTLTLGDGLEIAGPGTIERVIGAQEEILPSWAFYWLEVRYPDGTEHRYWEGPVTVGDP